MDDPAYRALGSDLRARMDDVLANRSVVAAERPAAEGEGTLKKKRRRADSTSSP